MCKVVYVGQQTDENEDKRDAGQFEKLDPGTLEQSDFKEDEQEEVGNDTKDTSCWTDLQGGGEGRGASCNVTMSCAVWEFA